MKKINDLNRRQRAIIASVGGFLAWVAFISLFGYILGGQSGVQVALIVGVGVPLSAGAVVVGIFALIEWVSRGEK